MKISLLARIEKICSGGIVMKRIITAMGNSILNNELRKYAKYDVLFEDVFCQDILLSKMEKCEYDVLIISGLLQGQWNLEEFVEKIRKKNNTVRVIVVTDEIDSTTKKLLERNNILDIFIDSTVEIQNIIDAIDREENIRKKYEMINENVAEYSFEKSVVPEEINKESNYKFIVEKAVQKQEIIAISGINGSGKSTIAINLCKSLSGKSDAKILLIDLDTLNGNLDEILNIDRFPTNIEMVMDEDKKSGINYACELIMKNRFDSNVFDELVIDAGGFDVLTGNTSLHYCQNILKEEYYENILKCSKEKYDFIIIDTSSNIFIDSTKWALQAATKVLFVIESNYVSFKKMQQFIHVITNIWGIWKQKIEIIVNKKNKNLIDNEVIVQISDGLKIAGEIKLNEENNLISYEKILSNINYIPKKGIKEKISEIKKNFFATANKMDREVITNVN